MQIDFRKLLLAAVVTVSGAGLLLGEAQAGKGPPVPDDDEGENVVVSLQTSPFLNAEPSCVGVQIATNLLLDDVNGPDPGGEVTPAESVTLFVTLQGVDAVSPRMDGLTEETAPVELFCTTPQGDKLLPDLIAGFVARGGKILVCPLCWMSRYPGAEPLFGAEVGNGVTVHNLFLEADQVIDF